jgi:hypothetical protein
MQRMVEAQGFVYLTLAVVGLVVLILVLVGHYYPGSGAEILDWKPTRSIQLEAELEQNDVEQMLAAQNERRRARGAPERTLEELERDVTHDLLEYRDAQRRMLESELDPGVSAWHES